MNERSLLPPPAKRFEAVGFCLTAIRIWQWASSFFVYASFSLLYDHIQKNRLGGDERMRGVQVLVCILIRPRPPLVMYLPVGWPRKPFCLSRRRSRCLLRSLQLTCDFHLPRASSLLSTRQSSCVVSMSSRH